MKFIINLLTILFLIGIKLDVNGQSIDSKSKTILEDITKNYKSKKNSYFKFSYSSGKSSQNGFFYSDNKKYRLKVMGIEQIFDGKKVYNISEEDKEITIALPNSNQVTFSPLSYLDSYKNDYNVSYSGKTTISGISLDVIKMIPVKSNGIKLVNLFINTPQKKLLKLEQISSNNQSDVLTITNYIENQTLSPSIFVFDKSKYKNYLITEL